LAIPYSSLRNTVLFFMTYLNISNNSECLWKGYILKQGQAFMKPQYSIVKYWKLPTELSYSKRPQKKSVSDMESFQVLWLSRRKNYLVAVAIYIKAFGMEIKRQTSYMNLRTKTK